MNIVFNKVDIENFFSIGNTSLSVNDCGYVMVEGINNNTIDGASSNGSGKSSIWESIIWALTGTTVRGSKDVVNMFADGGTLVRVDFSIDGNNYEVTRTKNHKKLKTNLKVLVNGEDKSGKGIRDTEKILESLLPDLTASLIGSVIILGQGLPQRFSNNSPSGRKEVLEKLSKSDFMIADLKSRIAVRKAELDTNIRNVEDSILKAKTKKSLLESQKEEAENKECSEEYRESLVNGKMHEEEAVEADSNSIDVLSSRIENAEKEVQKLRDDYNSIRVKCTEEKSVVTKEQSVKAEKVALTYREKTQPVIESIAELKAQISHTKAEITRIKSITDVCPTCGQKLIGVEKPSTVDIELALVEYEKSLKENQNLLDSIKSCQTKEEQSIKVESDNLCSEIDLRYAEELNNIKVLGVSAKENLDKMQSDMIALKKSKQEHEKMVNDYNIKINEYDIIAKTRDETIARCEKEIASTNEILMYNIVEKENIEKHLSVVSKFSTMVSRDFRGYLLSSTVSYIDSKVKEFSNIVFGNKNIDFIINGNDIDIAYCGKPYENLSGGEKQKVDVIIQFAIRDMLCRFLDFSSNILVVDEIFDNLDSVGCSSIINLISSKMNDISSIFIVTHHSDIDIPYDHKITVHKQSDGVSVVNVI